MNVKPSEMKMLRTPEEQKEIEIEVERWKKDSVRGALMDLNYDKKM